MKMFNFIYRILRRFRYPVSLPEDIAHALGVEFSYGLTFEEFVAQLQCPQLRSTRLKKYMPRQQAEEAFKSALRIDRFSQKSLFSYYFNEGWMEFILQFDEQGCLRRVYLQHKYIPEEMGLEILLSAQN
ncbi:hypothetical protein DB41_IB01050 [Neochlamydia sp. TUME1]|nr:hypothetical protein DB41_IB01050 [Neochlamydia sp. TUME1]